MTWHRLFTIHTLSEVHCKLDQIAHVLSGKIECMSMQQVITIQHVSMHDRCVTTRCRTSMQHLFNLMTWPTGILLACLQF